MPKPPEVGVHQGRRDHLRVRQGDAHFLEHGFREIGQIFEMNMKSRAQSSHSFQVILIFQTSNLENNVISGKKIKMMMAAMVAIKNDRDSFI